MARAFRYSAAVILALALAFEWTPATAATLPGPYRIATGLDGAPSADHVALGDRTFWVSHGNSGTGSMDSELWTSDGSAAGTHEFFDPNPGGLGRVGSLQAFGAGFVFTADDGVHGREAWYSDGSVAGTAMIADLGAPAQDDTTSILDAGPNVVFLSSDDGEHGDELYRWSGPGSVPQLLDINTTDRMTSDSELQSQWRTDWTNSGPMHLGMIGDTLVFTANQTIRTAAVDEWGDHYVATSGTGRELWRAGPSGPASLVADISDSDPWSLPSWQLSTRFPTETGTAVLGGALYFLTEGTDDDTTRPELWRTNGSPAGTSQVAALPIAYLVGEGADHWDFEPIVAGGKLFYAAWNGAWDGLWATSGTDAGRRVSPAGEARAGAALGGGTVFTLTQPATGREPWFSDGSTSTLLGDLRAGAAGSIPFPIATWGGHAYFGANGGAGRDLYRTDGTPAGTQRVGQLPHLAGVVVDGPMAFHGAQSRLYFLNSPDDDRNVDNELWAFDPLRVTGTATATVLRAPAVIAYGAGGTVTVTVSGAGGTPTGAVTIRDGANVLGTVELQNGRATFALPRNLALGNHALTAVYAGSADFDSSTSATVSVVVKAATKLTGKISSLAFGPKEKIRVTAKLTTTPAIKATGRMELLVDGKRTVTATLTAQHGNTLVLVSKPLKVGAHRLQVVFTASPNAMDARTGVARITVVR